jgi:lysozyme
MDVRSLIIEHEKLVTKPYKDSRNLLTIGVGRCLDTRGISESEALFLFNNDLQDVKLAAKKYHWFDELTEVRQAAIMDLLFNLGPDKFAGFRNFIQAMSLKQYTWAVSELKDSLWFKQVGRRGPRICSMILSNEWPT